MFWCQRDRSALENLARQIGKKLSNLLIGILNTQYSILWLPYHHNRIRAEYQRLPSGTLAVLSYRTVTVLDSCRYNVSTWQRSERTPKRSPQLKLFQLVLVVVVITRIATENPTLIRFLCISCRMMAMPSKINLGSFTNCAKGGYG